MGRRKKVDDGGLVADQFRALMSAHGRSVQDMLRAIEQFPDVKNVPKRTLYRWISGQSTSKWATQVLRSLQTHYAAFHETQSISSIAAALKELQVTDAELRGIRDAAMELQRITERVLSRNAALITFFGGRW